jgi:hypothetical protein
MEGWIKMSLLIDFYLGKEPNPDGYMIEDILMNWTDEQLEECHSHIQWLFPLDEPSQYNPDAPIMTAEDMEAFRDQPELRSDVYATFLRMMGFYGLTAYGEEVHIVDVDRVKEWAWEFNHNFLRITRILKSMRLMGRPEYSEALFDALEEIPSPAFTDEVWGFWIKSVFGPL